MSIKKYLKFLLILITFLSCTSREKNKFIVFDEKEEESISTIQDGKFKKFKIESIKPVMEENEENLLIKKNEKRKRQRPDEKKKSVLKNIIKKEQSSNNSKGLDEKKSKEIKSKLNTNDFPKEFALYDRNSKKVWDEVNPQFISGEELEYRISYIGLTAAYAKLSILPDVLINNKKAYHFRGQVKSARYYSMIYSLDDQIDSYIDKESFLPLKYLLIQNESNKKIRDLQLFDHEKQKSYTWYKKIKGKVERKMEKESLVPKYFQDIFTSFFFARTIDFEKGKEMLYPVITKGKIWLMKATIGERETLDILGKEIIARAVKVIATPTEKNKKKNIMTLWYEDILPKRLLKFEAQVKIGTISGEIIESSN